MADVNYLQDVEENEKIKASVTNSNNHYLDNKIDSVSSNLTKTIEGNNTNLLSQIETNNTSLTNRISSLSKTVSSINSSKLSTSAIKKAANGYVKLSNGIIIQWGRLWVGDYNDHWVTLPTAFTSANYSMAGSATYKQTAGDKGSSWLASGETTTGFNVRAGFEQYKDSWIHWVAIGY